MTEIENMLTLIDWEFLREQKEYLENEAANDNEVGHIYEGLLGLVDALQDAAIKDGYATEQEVFGEQEGSASNSGDVVGDV